MNNDIVNEKELILLYGLRTARQKKRLQYKGFEKKLRTLDRERDDLWQKEKELGWVELNPPIVRGWKRYFVLREDVARSKQAVFYQTLLDKINTVNYHSRKDFTVKYRKGGKKLRKVEEQRLRYLHEVNKKITFSDKEKSYFEEREITDWTGKKFITVLVFAEAWRFVLRVRPNIITQSKLEDTVTESRLAEIDHYLEINNFKPVLAKFKGGSYNRRWWKDDEIDGSPYIYKNKSFAQILDAIAEEN